MTDAATQNPFAPPRANVQDHVNAPSEMVTATRMSRLLAYLVDVSPFFIVTLIGGVLAVMLVPGLLSRSGPPHGSDAVAIGFFLIVFGLVSVGWLIWNILLMYRYGQTVGKKFLGIRVVRMDGTRVSLPRFVFLRWLGIAMIGGVVGAILGAMGLRHAGSSISLIDFLMIFGAAHRCLHDYIADTQVVSAASSPNATLEGSRRL